MSDRPDREPSGEGPLFVGKQAIRILSDCLKWVGFRYGAPIYRAKPHFTLDDVKRALFPQVHGENRLVFTTKPGGSDKPDGEQIRMCVTTIREWEISGEDLEGDLFPTARNQRMSIDAWVLEGLLMTSDGEGDYTFATSDAYDRDEPYSDPARVPLEDENRYLKVLAVIASTKDGQVTSAVIQRVPSPADQMLQVPPP